MSNISPFKTPEQGAAANDDAELIREYFQVVHESFVLLHKFGFASDPGAILAALGLSRRSTEVETTTAAVEPSPSQYEIVAISNGQRQAANLADEARRRINEMPRAS